MSTKKIERNVPLEPLNTLVGSLMGKYKGRRVTFQIFYGNVCLPIEYIDGRITHLKESTYVNVLRSFLTTPEGQQYIVPDRSEMQQVNVSMLELEHNGELEGFVDYFYGLNKNAEEAIEELVDEASNTTPTDNETLPSESANEDGSSQVAEEAPISSEEKVVEPSPVETEELTQMPDIEMPRMVECNQQLDNEAKENSDERQVDCSETENSVVSEAELNVADGCSTSLQKQPETPKESISQHAEESGSKKEHVRLVPKQHVPIDQHRLTPTQPAISEVKLETVNPWAQQAEEVHDEYIQVSKALESQIENAKSNQMAVSNCVVEKSQNSIEDDLSVLSADANDRSALDGKTVELHALSDEEIAQAEKNPNDFGLKKQEQSHVTVSQNVEAVNIEPLKDIDISKLDDLNTQIKCLYNRLNNFIDGEEERFYVPTNMKMDDGSEEENLDLIRAEIVKLNESMEKTQKANKATRNFQIVITVLILLSVVLNYLISTGVLSNIGI